MFSALDTLSTGRTQVIEVAGEPGMGKTCLLAGLAQQATARGVTVLTDRCTPAHRTRTRPSLARLLDQGPSFDIGAANAVHVRERGEDRLAAPRDDPLWEGSGEGDRRDRTLYETILQDLPRSFSGEGLLLIVDDFQWADPASIEIIEQLTLRPVGRPLLVVLAHRPRQSSPRLRGVLAHGVELGAVERIELKPLLPQQSAELIGVPVEDPALMEMHRESRGVPLYLMAVAAHRRLDELPEQLSRLIAEDLGQLDPCESLVTAAAAVLGDDWDVETLSAVAELSSERVRSALARLTELDLLRPLADGPVLAFRHPLVGELVRKNTGSAWQVAANRRAVEFLADRGAPASRLAVHVERSLAGPNPDDVRILREAAEEALSSAPAQAAHWLRVALDVVPADHGNERVTLLLLRTRALGLAGRLRESRDLLQEVLRLLPADRPNVRAATVAFCALVESLLGNYAEARAILAAELMALPSDDPPPAATALIIQHGMIGAIDGKVPACDQVNLAKRLARKHADRVAEAGALALSGLCDAFNQDFDGAADVLTQAAALADRLPDTDLTAYPEYLGVLGWAEALISRLSDAQRHFERGIAIARKYGHVHILSVMLVGQAATYLHLGQPGEARRLAAEARETAEQTNVDHVRGLALSLEALSAAWLGDVEAATSMGERAEQILNVRRFHWSPTGAVTLASIARLGGDPRRCLMLLLDAGGTDLQDLPPILRPSAFETLTAAALAVVEEGKEPPVATDRVAGWGHHAEAAAAAIDQPAAWAHAAAAHAHALRYEGRPGDALPLYRRASSLYSDAGMTHARALTLTAQAGALISIGRSEEAESTLLLAAELARRSGATLIERCMAAWRRHPGAPMPTADLASRLATLTAREREIAEIAGRGMRTRDIAAELSLSPRTVDVHLTRIYRKLEITSRSALVRFMADVR